MNFIKWDELCAVNCLVDPRLCYYLMLYWGHALRSCSELRAVKHIHIATCMMLSDVMFLIMY